MYRKSILFALVGLVCFMLVAPMAAKAEAQPAPLKAWLCHTNTTSTAGGYGAFADFGFSYGGNGNNDYILNNLEGWQFRGLDGTSVNWYGFTNGGGDGNVGSTGEYVTIPAAKQNNLFYVASLPVQPGTIELCQPTADPTATPSPTSGNTPTPGGPSETPTPPGGSTTGTPTPTAQPPHYYKVARPGETIITVPTEYVYPAAHTYNYDFPNVCGGQDENIGFYYMASTRGDVGMLGWKNSANGGQADLFGFGLGGHFYAAHASTDTYPYANELAELGLSVAVIHPYTQGGWDRIGINTWGTSALDLSQIYGICYGTAEPEPQVVRRSNLLCDGDMEDYFESTCWNTSDTGTITKPNGSKLEYTWDRLNTQIPPWPLWWYNWWTNGDAVCGKGYQGGGKNAVVGTNLYAGQGKGAASAIEQAFEWAGGTLYWRVSARGKFMRFFPTTPQGKAVVTIFADSNSYPLLNEQALTVDWQTFHGSLDLPAGQYRIKLDAWDKERFSINTVNDGAIYYDDVYLSGAPLNGQACQQMEDTPTATATPSVTPTGTGTLNPSETAYVTPTGMGHYTPTPAPTTTSAPDLLTIWNCGFEAGSMNWGINQASAIVLAGGPTGAQALRATGDWPSAWQNFNSKGAQTYLTAWVKGQTVIQAVNLDTNQVVTYSEIRDYGWSWQKIYATAYIPEGRWRLELNDALPPGSEGFFDGITLAYNTYATGADSWCSLEPTQGPTPYVTPTQRPSATLGASSTPWPTATIPPWWTPIPTGTPRPTGTPNVQATNYFLTATALGTPNPWEGTATAMVGTATAWAGTATAMGTPAGTGMPGTPGIGTPGVGTPTPGNGNGGVGGADPGSGPCKKPGWEEGIGAWTDAQVCEVKNYFSFGPGNVDQLHEFRNSLNAKEPFGTIAEITEAGNALKQLASSYAWNNTGINGTKGGGNPFGALANLPPSFMTGAGGISLNGNGHAYSMHCSTGVTDYAGPKLAPGMCWIFDILYQTGLLPIFQVIIDACCLWAIFAYFNNNFIAKHS